MDANEIMEYRRTFTIRQEETVRFQQYQAAHKTRRFVLFCMVLITLAAIMILRKIVPEPNETQTFIASLIGMVVGIALPYFIIQLMVAFNISQKYQNGQAHDYVVDVYANPGGIYFSDDKMEVKVYYDKMYMIVETSADFFVFPDKQTALLIPKHQMENVKEESRYLRQMFHTYATENKLRLMKG